MYTLLLLLLLVLPRSSLAGETTSSQDYTSPNEHRKLPLVGVIGGVIGGVVGALDPSSTSPPTSAPVYLINPLTVWESCSTYAIHGKSGVTFSALETVVETGSVGVGVAGSLMGVPVLTLGNLDINNTAANDCAADKASILTNLQGLPCPQNPDGTAIAIPVGLGGITFSPGVHCSGTMGTAAEEVITLDGQGDPNAEFIFKAGTTLVTGVATIFALINGAQAANVYWVVGTAATFGANNNWVGHVIASAAISVGADNTIEGRLIGGGDAGLGAITVDGGEITLPTYITSSTPSALATSAPSVSFAPSYLPSSLAQPPSALPSSAPSSSPSHYLINPLEIWRDCKRYAVHGNSGVTFFSPETVVETGSVGVGVGLVLGVPAIQAGSLDDKTAASLACAADKGEILAGLQDILAVPCTDNILVGLGGITFSPGVYCSGTMGTAAEEVITLDGRNNTNAEFVFRTDSTLTTGADTRVELINDARAENVYWVIGSAATFGDDNNFVGQMIASAAITVGSRTAIEGRLISGGGATGALVFNSDGRIKLPIYLSSSKPSASPSQWPSVSLSPSDSPSLLPSVSSSASPSSIPSTLPSVSPSLHPSALPSSSPSLSPSHYHVDPLEIWGKCKSFAIHGSSALTFSGAQSVVETGSVGAGMTGVLDGALTGTPLPLITAGSLDHNNIVAEDCDAEKLIIFDKLDSAVCPPPPYMAVGLGGITFSPGVYCSGTMGTAAGEVITLDGNGNTDAEFIFKASSAITTGAGLTFDLTNGARAENVYWVVGTAVTFDANNHFVGQVIAKTAITVGADFELDGRLIADAVTVNSGVFRLPIYLSTSKPSPAPSVAPSLFLSASPSSSPSLDGSLSPSLDGSAPPTLSVGDASYPLDPLTVWGECVTYAIHGNSGVTFAGTAFTVTTGSVGSSPVPSITGELTVSVGSIDIHPNAAAQSCAADKTAIFDSLHSLPCPPSAIAVDLALRNFAPGVHCGGTMGTAPNAVIVLDGLGDEDAQFIFKTATTLITGADLKFALVGGARPSNVYWSVGTSATLGAGNHFVGQVVASASISVGTGAQIRGRLISGGGATGAVTFAGPGSIKLPDFLSPAAPSIAPSSSLPSSAPSSTPTITQSVPSHCFDDEKSNSETDVDCGGSCLGCAVGLSCNEDSDCLYASNVGNQAFEDLVFEDNACDYDGNFQGRVQGFGVCVVRPPLLTGALFSPQGNTILVNFDSPTNMLNYNPRESFDCQNIFEAAKSDNVVSTEILNNAVNVVSIMSLLGGVFPTVHCEFLGSDTIEISIASQATILPSITANNDVDANPNALRMLSGVGLAGPGFFSQESQRAFVFAVDYSDPPLIPQAIVVHPFAVGRCDSIRLDGSMSSGSGGRALVYKWSIKQVTPNNLGNNNSPVLLEEWVKYDSVIALLAVANDMKNTRTLSFEGHELPSNFRYTFQLVVSNFQGEESNAIDVEFVKENEDIPIAIITGADLQTTLSSSLSLQVSASFPTFCQGGEEGLVSNEASLGYSWSLRDVTPGSEGQVDIVALRASSPNFVSNPDPKVLVIPPNRILQVNHQYEASVRVRVLTTASDSAPSTIESAIFTVVPQPIIVDIVGGNRTVTRDFAFALDGSASRDPDETSPLMLVHEWKCFREAANGRFVISSDSTITDFAVMSADGARISFSALSLPAFNYMFNLKVASNGKSRPRVVFVDVRPESVNAPPDTQIISAVPSRINPSISNTATLRLAGTAATPDNTPITIQWSHDEVNGVAFASQPSFGFSSYFAAPTNSLTTSIQLKALAPGFYYTFRMTATDIFDQQMSASASFYVNKPPSSGSIAVTPTSGDCMVESFALQASNWVDADLPLTYTYRYSVTGKGSQPVVLDSTNQNAVSTLPPGDLDNDGAMTIIVRVTDRFGASAEKSTLINVRMPIMNENSTLLFDVMSEEIDLALRSRDGAQILSAVSKATSSAVKVDPLFLLGKLEDARGLMGVSGSGIEQFTATINVITADLGGNVEASRASLSFIDKLLVQGQEVDQNQDLEVEVNDGGSSDKAVLAAVGVSNVLRTVTADSSSGGGSGVEAVDGVLNRISLIQTRNQLPGMPAAVLVTENILATANVFGSGNDETIESSHTANLIVSLSRTSAARGQFAATLFEMPRDVIPPPQTNASGVVEDSIAVSSIVSLSIWADGDDEGFDLGEGVRITIPNNLADFANVWNNTDASKNKVVTCSVYLNNAWDSTSCTLQNSTATESICFCPSSAFQTRAREGDDQRRLIISSDVFEGVPNAFVRAAVHLQTPITLDRLHQQVYILIIMASIYGLYFMISGFSIVRNSFNRSARHEELLKSLHVERAIQAMKENFIRMELSQKVALQASSRPAYHRKNSMYDDDVSSDGGKTVESSALDVFVDPRAKLTSARSSVTMRFMSRRNTDMSSFDDEDDVNILRFLSTSDRIDWKKEEEDDDDDMSDRSSSETFVAGDASVPGNSRALSPSHRNNSENDLDEYDNHRAERTALIEQERKLSRLKNNKLDLFWENVKKDHEVFSGFNKVRRSLSFKMPSSPRKLGAAALVKDFSSGSIAQASSPKALSSSNSSVQVVSTQPIEAYTKLEEMEVYTSTAHRATVILCQILSFLAMAVFFFERNESLFSEVRWEQFKSASWLETTQIIAEQFLEGSVQVALTFPVTVLLVKLFKRLDKVGTAQICFEIRVATDKAKLLHGISKVHPVDLRRSIHEVAGLLRIVDKASGKQKREDRDAVKYTLQLLQEQLAVVRAAEATADAKELRTRRNLCKKGGGFDITAYRNIRNAFYIERLRRKEVEDVLVRLCSLEPVRQALFLKDRRATNHMNGRWGPLKKYLYVRFLAEKEGYDPTEVNRGVILFYESIVMLYLLFLTFYLLQASLAYGINRAAEAVASFAIEVALSLLLISPLYILVRRVLIPSLVARIVEKDVKVAQDHYRKRRGTVPAGKEGGEGGGEGGGGGRRSEHYLSVPKAQRPPLRLKVTERASLVLDVLRSSLGRVSLVDSIGGDGGDDDSPGGIRRSSLLKHTPKDANDRSPSPALKVADLNLEGLRDRVDSGDREGRRVRSNSAKGTPIRLGHELVYTANPLINERVGGADGAASDSDSVGGGGGGSGGVKTPIQQFLANNGTWTTNGEKTITNQGVWRKDGSIVSSGSGSGSGEGGSGESGERLMNSKPQIYNLSDIARRRATIGSERSSSSSVDEGKNSRTERDSGGKGPLRKQNSNFRPSSRPGSTNMNMNAANNVSLEGEGEDAPQNWSVVYHQNGTISYHNKVTKSSTPVAPGAGFSDNYSTDRWDSYFDDGHERPYYVNLRNGNTSWDAPDGWHGRKSEDEADSGSHSMVRLSEHLNLFVNKEDEFQKVVDKTSGKQYFFGDGKK